jgi:hypothetical protein
MEQQPHDDQIDDLHSKVLAAKRASAGEEIQIPEDMTIDLTRDPELLAIMRRTNPRVGLAPPRWEVWLARHRWLVMAIFVALVATALGAAWLHPGGAGAALRELRAAAAAVRK